MASEAVPEAIDGLYEVPPAGFVQARNALVKSLKAGGQREQAEEAAKLSRPTVAVWASNQVARRASELVAQLADATARLQGGVTRDREKYAAAINHHRDLLNQVRERIETILADAGLRAAPATIAAAVQNFRTGLMDAHTRPLLLHGRLTQDVGLEAGAGLFGVANAFAPADDEPRPAPHPKSPKPPATHAADAKAREQPRGRTRAPRARTGAGEGPRGRRASRECPSQSSPGGLDGPRETGVRRGVRAARARVGGAHAGGGSRRRTESGRRADRRAICAGTIARQGT